MSGSTPVEAFYVGCWMLVTDSTAIAARNADRNAWRVTLASLVGTMQHVLVEGCDKDTGALSTGRTERNEIVHIAGAPDRDLTQLVGRQSGEGAAEGAHRGAGGGNYDDIFHGDLPLTSVGLMVGYCAGRKMPRTRPLVNSG